MVQAMLISSAVNMFSDVHTPTGSLTVFVGLLRNDLIIETTML